MRIDIRKAEALKSNGEIIGNHTKCKVVKNKIAPPFKTAEFDIMYGEGISREGELIDLGVQAEVIQKAGAWFSFDGNRLGQGRDKVKELLKNDPELYKEIETKLWENIDKLYATAKPKAKKAVITKAEEPAAAPKADAKSSKIDILAE